MVFYFYFDGVTVKTGNSPWSSDAANIVPTINGNIDIYSQCSLSPLHTIYNSACSSLRKISVCSPRLKFGSYIPLRKNLRKNLRKSSRVFVSLFIQGEVRKGNVSNATLKQRITRLTTPAFAIYIILTSNSLFR